MLPIVATSKFYLVSIYRSDIFLLAAITRETQPLMVMEFLHRVFEIFEEYFGTVEETSIKENFSTVYQLLEVMLSRLHTSVIQDSNRLPSFKYLGNDGLWLSLDDRA